MCQKIAHTPKPFVRRLLFTLSLAFISAPGSLKGQPQSSEKASPARISAPELEVASIKPVKNPDLKNMRDTTEGRRLFARNMTLQHLMTMAYEIDVEQISSGPKWMATDAYDIDAEAVEGVQLDDAQEEEELLRELLSDRFKLTFHREQRMLPVYVMVVAKDGPRLKPANPSGIENTWCERPWSCTFKKRTLSNFAKFMQFNVLDRPVVDMTGIAGEFDFSLKWAPDESQFSRLGIFVRQSADDSSAPPVFTAIQEQLGLQLVPKKAPVDVLVIDRVERPTPN